MRASILSCSLILFVTFSITAREPASIESANVTSTIAICGVVSSYTAATVDSAGALTIGGRNLAIAPGTAIGNADWIRPGADLCLRGTVDEAGQLVDPTSVYINPARAVSVCGFVVEYEAADAENDGNLTIDDRVLTIAAGTEIENADLIVLGVHICLRATVNASGMIIAPSSVTLTSPSDFAICGVITAFAAPTSDSSGYIVIGGTTYKLAGGAFVEGEIELKACLCLDASQAIGGDLLRISVHTANRPPVMELPTDQSVSAGERLRFDLSASDEDLCDTLTITASDLPANATLLWTSGNPARGELLFDTTQSQSSRSYVVWFTATDQLGASDTKLIVIHVRNATPIGQESMSVDVPVARVVFRSTPANGSSNSIAIPIRNGSPAPLTITSIVLEDGSHFTLEGAPDRAIVLAPDATIEVSARFRPRTQDPVTDAVVVTSDDRAQPVMEIGLEGNVRPRKRPVLR